MLHVPRGLPGMQVAEVVKSNVTLGMQSKKLAQPRAGSLLQKLPDPPGSQVGRLEKSQANSSRGIPGLSGSKLVRRPGLVWATQMRCRPSSHATPITLLRSPGKL